MRLHLQSEYFWHILFLLQSKEPNKLIKSKSWISQKAAFRRKNCGGPPRDPKRQKPLLGFG